MNERYLRRTHLLQEYTPQIPLFSFIKLAN